jgi:hypothetical protein
METVNRWRGASMKRGNLIPRRLRKGRRSARLLLLRIESA